MYYIYSLHIYSERWFTETDMIGVCRCTYVCTYLYRYVYTRICPAFPCVGTIFHTATLFVTKWLQNSVYYLALVMCSSLNQSLWPGEWNALIGYILISGIEFESTPPELKGLRLGKGCFCSREMLGNSLHYMWLRPYGPQSLTCLLSAPLQKNLLTYDLGIVWISFGDKNSEREPFSKSSNY